MFIMSYVVIMTLAWLFGYQLLLLRHKENEMTLQR